MQNNTKNDVLKNWVQSCCKRPIRCEDYKVVLFLEVWRRHKVKQNADKSKLKSSV